jgi:kynurenine formamidase
VTIQVRARRICANMSFVPFDMQALQDATIIDLAQEWRVGMPHWPAHPPFLYGLSKAHGDIVTSGGVSSSSETLTLGGHVGTHLDALCHFSQHGKLYGGVEAATVQSVDRGFRALGVDTVKPIVRRGVLFDVAGPDGELPPDRVITAGDLERASAGVRLERGNLALIRTGWGRYWNEPRRMANAQAPGPGIEAAQWLSAHGIFAAGSDTLAFEATPTNFVVHVHLLVEQGIHIIEALNLEELAATFRASGPREFLFVGAPLKISGGTGSPMRPFALL